MVKSPGLRDFDKWALNLQKGDERAGRVIFDHFAPLLFRYFMARLGNRGRAEDLTQEVFLKLVSRIETFDPKLGAFVSWFWQVARNVLVDFYREKKDVLFSDLSEEEIDVAAGDYDAESQTELKEVLKAVGEMGEEDQELFSLRYLSELSYREISKISGKSESALRVAAHRIRRKLTEKFNDRNN